MSRFSESEMDLLSRIEAGAYHALPTSELAEQDHVVADALLWRGIVAKLPSNGRMPARYVLTARGQYAIGSFDFAA